MYLAEDYDSANEAYHTHVDPYLTQGGYPGYIADSNGTVNPQELNPVRPTGYLPNADDYPQVPYDRAADLMDVLEYDPRFPVEPLDSSESVDQHPFMHVTATITVADDDPRKTGTRDPMISGPARPDTILLNLFEYRGAGTDNNKYMDVPDGRTFSPYGTQDGSTWLMYQDPYEALAPLNQAQGLAEWTAAGRAAPSDPSQNLPAQQTVRTVAPGPAHGWTEVPVVNVKQEANDKATRWLKQQQAPHQDRKANSTYAGQTYSQRTATVTQAQGSNTASGPDNQWW